MDNVFVIGDVHGNLDRLEALLKQEGLLVWCEDCEGGGDKLNYMGLPLIDSEDCPVCKGIGWARAKTDVTIVQLGDLGHFGSGGSPTGDMLCYKYVTENRWADVVLWGNHDRALVDSQHAFTGFEYPRDGTVLHYLIQLHEQGRLQTAFDAHGFLLTHAGLAAHFKQQAVDPELKTDLTKFVDWINDEDEKYLTGQLNPRAPYVDFKLDLNAIGVINAISSRRGGRGAVGGILWRDINESLYQGFRQIFGHSADHRKRQVRYCTKGAFSRSPGWADKKRISYCIDIGGKAKDGQEGACLAGIWLPSEKIVEIRL